MDWQNKSDRQEIILIFAMIGAFAACVIAGVIKLDDIF